MYPAFYLLYTPIHRVLLPNSTTSFILCNDSTEYALVLRGKGNSQLGYRSSGQKQSRGVTMAGGLRSWQLPSSNIASPKRSRTSLGFTTNPQL